MKRTLVIAFAVLAAGCSTIDRGQFSDGTDSGGEDDACEQQGFSYLVQEIVDAESTSHYTCAAPEAIEDGPAFDGWFAPATVVPGGLLTVTLFSDHAEDLPGRTLILDAPEVLGHSRFQLTDDHQNPRGARFQVLLRHDLAAGPQTLKVALLDDFGEVEATGPVIEIPVHVVEVDEGPRGLRIALNFWSEDDPDAAPDVNLQVFEPDGNRIDADAPTSGNGGVHEFDGNEGCGDTGNLESVSWPQGSALGRYSAFAFFADSCGSEGDFHWTVSFSYFDRLLGVWEGEIGPPHGDDPENDIINLSWIELE